MSTLLSLLLPLTILFSWLRLVGRGSHQFLGQAIGSRAIPLLARFYMHAMPIAVSVLVAVSLAAIGVTPWAWVLAPIASGAALVAVPLRYSISDTGIRRTFGPFRRWTEFAGVERAPGGARLKPLPNTRPARIWLSGSRGDDEFLQLVRTLIRNAYKGKADVVVFPGTGASSPDHQSSMSSTIPGIAAFQRSECV